ncbi:small ribosomal subunit biogenesis GTPase RsgA [Geitlerinema sp. P-1104]|uniref:small ribosomal subunit biogenesis GTPase RsgA n=1 Tax=Geitlerinema sp. P-1104 TaxID=2546230 RepID=UPI0014778554|nr:small ribosomal subunit biogenesis GTPase RsgA [Geitlerinema sp. P-1104]NMG58258.1 small ribosomal subunit biogenesis GTPase RsgA [Geitlerinema sp. P-1104]
MSDRPSMESEVAYPQGTVLAVQANFYQVQLDDDPPPPRPSLLCTRRTRLKKVGQQVMVGDRVVVEEPDWEGNRGAIGSVLPRHTELDRPPVANADRILLLFTLDEPSLDPWQLSRFLVKAESTQLSVELCLNKCDLVDEEGQNAWRSRLRQWGYEPLLMSVKTGWGLEAVAQRLERGITILAGPSGVGKSSTINRLIPQANLRVAQVSGKLGRGRHTTRHVELFELEQGGLLADTPGFNQPQLTTTAQELADCFPEIRQRRQGNGCHFSDCRHRDEPGCQIRGDWERYEHYLTFLEEAIAQDTVQQHSGEEESSFKRKAEAGGERSYEPKLASKKYRRQSRRRQHQTLQELCEELDEQNE